MKRLVRQLSLLVLLSLGLFLSSPYRARAEELDIRQIPGMENVVHDIEDVLPKPGNKGSARVDSLVFDTEALEVRGTATIVAKHSWGEVCDNLLCTSKSEAEAQKTFTASFVYNLQTQRIRGDANLGKVELSFGSLFSISLGEVKVDLERLQRAIEGDLVALVELIPTGDVVENETRNEYEQIRQSKWDKHGRENVYFASREFVNWASPERIGVWVIELILSGGGASGAIMSEVSSEALKEFTPLVDWLTDKGVDQAASVAEQLLTNGETDAPFVALYWQTVKYESRRKIAGNPVTPWIPIRHAAYYIVWEDGSSGNNPGSGGSSDDQNTPAAQQPCPDAFSTRLHNGERAIVNPVPPQPNRVRNQPSRAGVVIGWIEAGESMDILDGPRCADGWIWWYVRSDGNVTGWTTEGNGQDQWLIPEPGTVVIPPLSTEHCRTIGDPSNHSHHVVRYYRATRECTVGPLTYYLVNGQAPSGTMPNEHCLAFNPADVVAREDLGAVIDGRQNLVLLHPFDNGQQVRDAYAVLQQHRFTHVCSLQHNSLGGTYLRR